jgi:hypothetical protein
MRGLSMNARESERELVQEFNKEGMTPPSQGLYLRVDERNIDSLEARSCGQTGTDLKARLNAAYETIPSRGQLTARYGDSHGKKIYRGHDEVERLWLDRCLRECDISFERGLTHLR